MLPPSLRVGVEDKYEVCSKYYREEYSRTVNRRSTICGSRTPIARKTKRHAEPGYTRPLYCYKCKTITEFCEEL